jgi:membrane-associated phospholipid phosphatase
MPSFRLLTLWLLVWSAAPAAHAQPDSLSHPRGSRPYIAPTALLAGSLITLRQSGPLNKIGLQRSIQQLAPGFRSTADDYLPYLPIALVYGLDWAGLPARNDFINRSLLLVKAGVLSQVVTQGVKRLAQVPRPDGSNALAWPSGHTTQAFVAAAFLHRELGDRSVWYPVGGYALASGVGLMRILNNEHWVPDVLAGAAVGLASTELVYRTHRYRWGRRRDVVAHWVPFRAQGATGVLVLIAL